MLKSKDSFELSCDKDLYLIKCKKLERRKLLLDGGPVFVARRIMVIRPCVSEIEDKSAFLTSIPVWINLELLRKFWTPEGISYGASLFGESLEDG